MFQADNKSDALTKMVNADILITSNAIWDEDHSSVLDDCPHLAWIQLINAGYDNLVNSGIPHHIVLTTNGGTGADVVAEHAVAMLLALLRGLPAIIHSQEQRNWNFDSISIQLNSLHDKNVAIIGYGNVGRALAKLLSCFDVNITVVSRSQSQSDEPGVNVRSIDEMFSVLALADILFLAAPLTQHTELMIAAPEFAVMKKGCYLVNTARGRLVDTDALLVALQEGKLAGAAIDVTDPEPLPGEHPLWACPNVIISPHVAWAGGGEYTQRHLKELVLENTRRFLNGEPLKSQVRINSA